MNILIINGSPHTKGTTALLRDKFAEGAASAGHNITTFHACKEELHPCTGCDHCRTTENGCIYKDGKYSLQGTSQGNGLTGSILPVRFSM
nr:hypothetical protein [uncultured Bariatricus sp.]